MDPLADPGRLAALAETRLLDAAPSAVLDRYVRVLRNALGSRIALVSLIDDERQFFASQAGLPEPWASQRGTPLSLSFCRYVVQDRRELIVKDSARNLLVSAEPVDSELSVGAYAGVPIETEDGHVLGSFCAIEAEPRDWTPRELAILRDLSEAVGEEIALRRRLARAEASERDLEEVNRVLRERSSVHTDAFAHDIRTPFSVLSMGISYLSMHEATRSHPELCALVETLNRNVAHASALVTDMQTEGRRVQGGPVPEPLDLSTILAQVCADMAPVGGPLIERVEAGSYLVCVEPSSLRRCFENLLGNALRFAEQRVRVSTATDGDGGVVVSFDDDGPGLPDAESYHRAWEAGARFHTASGRSGSGLGLSIVKNLVEGHGGEVRAGPSVLGGAQFELYLPTAP